MSKFDDCILAMERELNDLKTFGLKSSSSLAVAQQTISITQQIVGYDYNYHLDSCASKAAAIIELVPNDGKPMLVSIAVHSGAQYLAKRLAWLDARVSGTNIAYEFTFLDGSADDLTFIQHGGTIPPFTMEFLISATSEFTVNLTYRQDH